ncbi:MAG TPA: TerC family protein [Thermomicrobiales bacterium]|nr:TerC family protein [Thermomicrobiales bacterium]
MLELIGAVLSIVVIDLVLSGDNAVVIGMAARQLSPANRRRAIVLGGGGAIALRIAFTAMAALLLDIPYLRFVGGLLLLWIAWKLVRPSGHAETVSEAESLGAAVRTIVLADVVMSLDNILAVGGAAHGQIELLMFGLLLSIPIILIGSELVARLLGRVPALLYVGVFVLVHTAVSMLLEDPLLHQFHTARPWEVWAAAAVVTFFISAVGSQAQRRRADHPAPPRAAPTADRTADRAA